ncbi:L-lactate dehydrogenase [Salmonella bongori]|nr:L-lactate dehydrogenase [Salmonella bongori]
MIISAASDYRAAAQRTLPPFLFHYIDGGAYAEYHLAPECGRSVASRSAPARAEKYV